MHRRLRPQTECSKSIDKQRVALQPRRLGTVDDRSPAAQVHALQIAVADLLRAKIEGKIGQPGERAAILADGLQEAIGRAHPVER